MKLTTITLAFALTLATAAAVVTAVEFRNPLHVFQLFAKDVFPDEREKQKEAVVTLKYLFQHKTWNEKAQWDHINDFLRTGGLNENPRSREAVTLSEASQWLQRGAIVVLYPSLLRPSLNTLIERHFKAAKKAFGYSDQLLVEPPNLLGSLAKKKTFRPVSQYFQGTPPVMTPEEAEELAGESLEASSSGADRQRRVKGLEDVVEANANGHDYGQRGWVGGEYAGEYGNVGGGIRWALNHRDDYSL